MKKKNGLLVFVAAAILLAVLAFTADSRKYNKAANAFERGEYQTAVTLYEELGDYKDSRQMLIQSHYHLAERSLQDGEYRDALNVYQMLGDYADSAEKVLACYYGLGEDALNDKLYEYAIDYFTQAGSYSDSTERILECYYEQGNWLMIAGDYLEANEAFLLAGGYADAAVRANDAIYKHGHALFVDGDFDGAQTYFDMLQGYPEGGIPHFRSLEEARGYLKEQSAQLASEIKCCVYSMPPLDGRSTLRDMIVNYIPFQVGSVCYYEGSKELYIGATYYPSERILYAWRTGDTSVLSEAELEAKNVAEKVVAKAQSNTKSLRGQELYLYNWLCNNVVYETPNMDVSQKEYLKLRQLTCVGALLDGKANCQGYTDAFYLMGTMIGLDVFRISGEGAGEPHCWNGVTLDGKQYMVDVTFGDWDDLGKKAKGYVEFNCVYDPEVYIIDGGVQCFPALVLNDDLSQSYYDSKDSIFPNRSQATKYLARQCKKNGKGWYYAVIEGAEVSEAKIKSSLLSARKTVGIYNGFMYLINFYDGDTHISVKWT